MSGGARLRCMAVSRRPRRTSQRSSASRPRSPPAPGPPPGGSAPPARVCARCPSSAPHRPSRHAAATPSAASCLRARPAHGDRHRRPHGAAAGAWLAGWCWAFAFSRQAMGCHAAIRTSRFSPPTVHARFRPCRATSRVLKSFLWALTRNIRTMYNQTADVLRHTLLGSMCIHPCGSTVCAAVTARPRGARRRCPRPSRPPAPACPAGGPSAAGSAGGRAARRSAPRRRRPRSRPAAPAPRGPRRAAARGPAARRRRAPRSAAPARTARARPTSSRPSPPPAPARARRRQDRAR